MPWQGALTGALALSDAQGLKLDIFVLFFKLDQKMPLQVPLHFW